MMKIRWGRRTSQIVFFLLFIWFAVVLNFGEQWWQWRGWPVNWILQLDPLVALGTVLATGHLFGGLLWALPIVFLTLLFGRVFCGWICPFGAMHQFFGWIGSLFLSIRQLGERNRYQKWQVLKYYILLVMLGLALCSLFGVGSLQTGLLDPIPLATRSVNLIMIPFLEDVFRFTLNANPRYYTGSVFIGVVLIGLLAVNLWIPRFFCRFLCPTGALLGLLSRFSLFRLMKASACKPCGLCERHCEGACSPSDKVRFSECVLCCNCMPRKCPVDVLQYSTESPAQGEIKGVNLERRGVLMVLGSTALAATLPTAGKITANTHHFNSNCIRPPGSLPEENFLDRCVKCGQCMRICPTNCLVPSDMKLGLEALWTPVMNFRIGTSGCQLNCTACSHVCPTAAIRPLILEEKLGLGAYADKGPIRVGTAFVDKGRCLPWANGRPCIVCQENCPVTPKAIHVETMYRPCSDFVYQISECVDGRVTLREMLGLKCNLATGDYWLALAENRQKKWRILSSDDVNVIEIDGKTKMEAGTLVCLLVKLEAPVVNFNSCIGCGVCEHECPVSGLRAIRVTSENESRNPKNSITPEGVS